MAGRRYFGSMADRPRTRVRYSFAAASSVAMSNFTMFIIAAILAPPDVITQCGLAIPLIGLYEISILAAKMVEPKPAPDLD